LIQLPSAAVTDKVPPPSFQAHPELPFNSVVVHEANLIFCGQLSFAHSDVLGEGEEEDGGRAVGGTPELPVEREEERNKLTAAQTRHQTTSQSRQAKIAALNEKWAALEIQIAKTEKEVSRLTLLVAQNKVRLDSRNKRLMDVLKVIARNSFYKALDSFRKDYN
jgi:hypothetical protein